MRHVTLLFLVLAFAAPGFAQNRGPSDESEAREESVDPMDVTSLSTSGLTDPELAKVLREYYQLQVGGWDPWLNTESFRLEGNLDLAQGFSLHFVAFKKKPDLTKIILTAENFRMILSYDGAEAWQIGIGEDVPTPMSESEALNFIRDAVFVTHLVDPSTPGKTVELLGQEQLVTKPYYHLRVTLPSSQVVDYYLDIKSFEIRMDVRTDASTGIEETTIYSDYRTLSGIRVPFRAVKRVEGKTESVMTLEKAEANIGLTPWFFSAPAILELEPMEDPNPDTPLLQGDAGSVFDTDTEQPLIR